MNTGIAKRLLHKSMLWVIVITLIALRYPFVYLVKVTYFNMDVTAGLSWFENTTYLLTALFIWLERKRLSDYRISWFAVLLFTVTPIVLFCLSPIQSSRLPITAWVEVRAVAGALLLRALFRQDHGIVKIDMTDIQRWGRILIWFGMVPPLVYNLLRGWVYPGYDVSLVDVVFLSLSQLGAAAIVEEPLFRGILLTVLERKGWSIPVLLATQAILFMSAHLYYLTGHLLAFLVVPFGGAFLTGIALYTDDLGNSMVVHGCMNAIAEMIW